MVYSKNIKIISENLGRDVTLMFTFEAPPGAGLYKDYFPLAWRIAYFPDKGIQSTNLNYTAQLAFNKAQVTSGNFVSPGTWTKCDPGQLTTLTPKLTSFVWEDPKDIGGNIAKARNGTKAVQDIGVGFSHEGSHTPETALYFRGVGVGYAISAQIQANLKVYVTLDYQETQVVRGEIESLHPIKEFDMADASIPTEYKLTYDTQTATFKLTAV